MVRSIRFKKIIFYFFIARSGTETNNSGFGKKFRIRIQSLLAKFLTAFLLNKFKKNLNLDILIQ